MTVKNFVFRENWVVSKVAGVKTTFFAIVDPTWSHILASQCSNKGLLKQHFSKKDRNYIINFVTLRLANYSEILENNQFFAIFDPNGAKSWS